MASREEIARPEFSARSQSHAPHRARGRGRSKAPTIYEVGPGPGGLTRALAGRRRARVIAVERDERCLPALADIAAAYPGSLEVVSADALTIDEAALLSSLRSERPVRIAANLPYNIGTALLVKWLTAEIGRPSGKA